MTERTASRLLGKQHLWLWFLSLGLVAAGVFFLLPRGSLAQGVLYTMLGIAMAGAIAVGISIHQPSQRLPWYLLLAGTGLYTIVGNGIWYLYPVGLGKALPYPSVADGVYLVGYLLELAGLVALTRARVGRSDRTAILDTALITIAAGVPSWIFLMEPYVRLSGLSPLARLVSIAYPVVDILLLAVLVRLTSAHGSRGAAHWFLTVYLVGELVSDTMYAITSLRGAFFYGHPLIAGWMISYAFLGAAVLHPSMRSLTQRLPQKKRASGLGRTALLVGAAFLPLAFLVTEDLRHNDFDIPIIAAMSGLMFLLVIARLRTLTADISQLEQAEEALRESEATLRTVFDASPDIITMLGPEGEIGAPGPAVGEVLGYEPEEFAKMDRVSLVHPQDRDRIMEAFLSVMEGEKGFESRYRVRHTDGHWVTLETRARAMADQEGQPMGAVAVSRDVTERVALEAALLRAKEEADLANRAKSEFLSRMSHELRTPLNAILGFGQLLEMDSLEGEQAEYVQQILNGGKHLLDLINEVLDIARIESGRLTMSLEPIVLADALREALDLINPLAAEQRVELKTEDSWPGDDYVKADRQRLKQVVLNLLSNAVKYNREGGTVTVRCLRPDEGRLRVEVSDDGPGIRSELIERLFVPFDRLGAEATGVEGTGLGLALSRGLIEAMGGSIAVESVVGKGSTFSIELPLADAPGTIGGESAAVERAVVGASAGSYMILYIEDNLANLRLIEVTLSHRPGLILLTAMQGSLGLDLARQHRPDLILLDLHLPDMPGERVLRHLQADPKTRNIPVIVISADATPGHIRELLVAGARTYLTKPIDVPRFFQAVDEALAERRLDDAV